MFSIPNVFGRTPADRNTNRDAHIVEALGNAEEALTDALTAIREVREQMASPSAWGDSAEMTMGTVIGRAAVVAGSAAAVVNRRTRDGQDALTKAVSLAGGYEATSEQ